MYQIKTKIFQILCFLKLKNHLPRLYLHKLISRKKQQSKITMNIIILLTTYRGANTSVFWKNL